jgi:hypothetical protein
MRNPKHFPEYYEQAIPAGLRFARGYFLYTYDDPQHNNMAVRDCKHSVVENANFGTNKEGLLDFILSGYFSEYGQKPV